MTTAEAGRARGTGRGTASKAAKRLGLTFARHLPEPTRADDEQLLRALRLKEQGYTAQATADLVGHKDGHLLAVAMNRVMADWLASER